VVFVLKQAEKQQRIIYSGRLLQDDVRLKDVLRQVSGSNELIRLFICLVSCSSV